MESQTDRLYATDFVACRRDPRLSWIQNPSAAENVAWQWPTSADWKQKPSKAVAATMLVAVGDREVMPVHSYRGYRAAFNMVLRKQASSPPLHGYLELCAQHKSLWACASRQAFSACVEQYAMQQPEACTDKYACELQRLLWPSGSLGM